MLLVCLFASVFRCFPGKNKRVIVGYMYNLAIVLFVFVLAGCVGDGKYFNWNYDALSRKD